MISAAGLAKRYGRVRALDGVDLEVPGGETAVLVGPNGSGKTTLLRVCAGLVRPDSGSVKIGGADPRSARHRIGYLGHEPCLYPRLTAEENLVFFAGLYGAGSEAALRWLDRVGLPHRASALVHTLSQGERRRVAIARCLLHDPDLVLADEPFAGLDEESASALPGLLSRPGRTMLISTHDLLHAGAMAARVVRLERGRIRSIESR